MVFLRRTQGVRKQPLLILNVEITIMATKPEFLVAKKEMLVAL